jgi:hypothetical protein
VNVVGKRLANCRFDDVAYDLTRLCNRACHDEKARVDDEMDAFAATCTGPGGAGLRRSCHTDLSMADGFEPEECEESSRYESAPWSCDQTARGTP